MTVNDRAVPSYVERVAATQAQLLASVHKAQKELVFAMAEKLHKLNTLARNTPFAYRLVETPKGPTCHLYQNDRFVRLLSASAVDRRLRDAIMASRARPAGCYIDELTGTLTPEEVRRRRGAMREALLATLNPSGKLKEQLAVLQGHQKLSPFVVE